MAISIPAATIRPLNSEHVTCFTSSPSVARSSSFSSQQCPWKLTPCLRISGKSSIFPSRSRTFHVVKASKQNLSSLEELVATSDKPLLVDFYATWCGPCQFMVPILDKVSSALEDTIQVVKIDTEIYPEIADKYKIEALPTFIIFKDGKPCDRFEGALTADQMIKRIESSLQAK
ncbi:hypothetical protein V2J09_008847 [Rumex salicifolius]